MIRTFSELRRLDTLEERFEYLQLDGTVGETTFGRERWVNQRFYHASEWRKVRSHVIARDQGLDLGAQDSPIRNASVIHHMNPIQIEDFEEDPAAMLDPEFLISTALRTHNGIHYGDKSSLPRPFVERTPGDTNLWRSQG